ncbi:CGNR zinc finger domain-containing protein [Fodinisporobacter ferrooxydans]|uniref:CGNR zinc finger domain-containing protein n=1 Tax=Fodinisporobacter ferrooxydans TaxID=2901836 RepID=A0ABY4CI78_9BACL|nr:CGNR zinc finger domain-containing protein [Alicyclobacillaceae bacterium MYW30-H2]
MAVHDAFPLVSGHLSLDLINTEVVRRGVRHDLLVNSEDLTHWIEAMEQAGSLFPDIFQEGYDSPEALYALRKMRDFLRKEFEKIADGYIATDRLRVHLEELVERAPFSYKVRDEALIPVPMGSPADSLISLVAFDALRLLATGDLLTLHRCANPDCVLMFMDFSGRRKWCSMKICGNRTKVARYQSKK